MSESYAEEDFGAKVLPEARERDQENDRAESYRIVFPAVVRVSSPHGTEPTVVGTQAVDEYRGKLAHDSSPTSFG